MQLAMRTEKQIFGDYNPSDEFSWIYEDIETRKDCLLINSTYKDNPFLSKDLVKEIESWQGKDDTYWKVYGLGEVGRLQNKVYNHWQMIDEMPE